MLIKRFALFAFLAGSALAAAPVLAQEQLALEPDVAWVHPHNGIAVPASLGGVPRAGGAAYADDHLDVSLSFRADDSEELSLYIYRKTNGGVPVWFAQSQWAIESRDIYGVATPAIGPQAFVPPGQSSASGLTVVYDTEGGEGLRSTGLTLFAVGDWYVKLRASSRARSPAELAEWMAQAMAGIAWPEAAASPVARPVVACDPPLAFPKKSKDARTDGGADILGSLLGTMAIDAAKEDGEAVTAPVEVQWCRDAELGKNQFVYRANGSDSSYLIALGDNGNAVSVARDGAAALLDTARSSGDRYAITLMVAAENIGYVAQDRLPSPQRVVEIVNANRRTVAINTWGEDQVMKVSPDAF